MFSVSQRRTLQGKGVGAEEGSKKLTRKEKGVPSLNAAGTGEGGQGSLVRARGESATAFSLGHLAENQSAWGMRIKRRGGGGGGRSWPFGEWLEET